MKKFVAIALAGLATVSGWANQEPVTSEVSSFIIPIDYQLPADHKAYRLAVFYFENGKRSNNYSIYGEYAEGMAGCRLQGSVTFNSTGFCERKINWEKEGVSSKSTSSGKLDNSDSPLWSQISWWNQKPMALPCEDYTILGFVTAPIDQNGKADDTATGDFARELQKKRYVAIVAFKTFKTGEEADEFKFQNNITNQSTLNTTQQQ